MLGVSDVRLNERELMRSVVITCNSSTWNKMEGFFLLSLFNGLDTLGTCKMPVCTQVPVYVIFNRRMLY